ncbi:MAG: DUF4157 domain-containing protein [Synechococcales bacterium]|nr:DUF4157 domain-containing protein [Synechococcales bacterium]
MKQRSHNFLSHASHEPAVTPAVTPRSPSLRSQPAAVTPPSSLAPVLHDILHQPSHSAALPEAIRTGVEGLSGIALDQVRVHYNSPQPARIAAHAYTQGTDIHLAPGQEQQIAHEVWHVVQQAQGRVHPTNPGSQNAVTIDRPLEQEADRMGSQIAQAATQPMLSPPAPLAQNRIPPAYLAPIQPKLIAQANPVLRNNGVMTDPTAGAAQVKPHAQALSNAVDQGYTDVEAKVKEWSSGTKTAQEVKDFFDTKTSGSYTQNFVNRLTDWQIAGPKQKGRKMGLAKAAAGYIIEDYATQVASVRGLTTQSAIGGARLDFEVITGKTWTLSPGQTFPANGLIDATSETEAAKGHSSGKVLKMEEADAMAYPHLYDVYYPSLKLGAAPKVSTAALTSDATIQQRVFKQTKLAAQQQQRMKSLRSHKQATATGLKKTGKKVGGKKAGILRSDLKKHKVVKRKNKKNS